MLKKILIIASVMMLVALLCGCQQVPEAEEFSDNTAILTNPGAPVPGDPDISAVSGYTEAVPKGLKLPYSVPDTDIELLSVGSYTGRYIEDKSGDSCTGVPAVVVRNTSDKVISYSCITVRYGEGDEDVTSFMPTNIPAGCCAVVLASDKELTADKLASFEVTSAQQILSDKLTVIEGKAGVSYSDGAFIVTNLTDESLGEVYIRYKLITPGNCYLGGVTYTVNTDVLPAHTTVKLFASFDEKNCSIVAVESVK